MMVLLIPGPSSPGKDFDVFLKHLVDDLLELWKGVDAYDAKTEKSFKLHATVLWCIHDYPTLSTLSGRTTKGYFACIHCDKDPAIIWPEEQNWLFWALPLSSKGTSFA